ncbi:pre-mRNA 3'-end-processing factor FIP1 [Culicoides brevitarsis]|uniref:pre-mRNA 3'-end-processing factor FIP1 n=1 Tax=Culicoides brevitarsis TaxID=469753 RepID=UPI00307CAA6B
MATMEDENDESWLYGNSEGKDTASEQPPGTEDDAVTKVDGEENAKNNSVAPVVETEDGDAKDDEPEEVANDEEVHFQPANEMEDETMEEAFHEDDGEEKSSKNQKSEDEDSDSDEDDDINVVIGDIKSGPTYNIKHRGQINSGAPNAAGAKQPAGKFNIEEFESVGTIAGVAAHEFSIDSLEDKPWRKPGADITDYFNYGFNEDTWRSYCERQKRFRVAESGVGLASLSQHVTQPVPNANGPSTGQGMGGGFMSRRFGAPRFRHPGHIGVIGGENHQNNRDNMDHMGNRGDGDMSPMKNQHPKENVIQVMTADRREYSRMNRGFGMDDQPPMNEQPFYEENQFNYMNQYEPTQDSQAWMGGGNSAWGPSGIKELTPGPNLMQQQQNMGPPGHHGPPGHMGMPPGMNMGPNMGGNHPNMGGMNIPSHMNAPPNQNRYDNRRGDMGRGPPMDRNDRMQRRRSRSPRSRSRDRMRRPRSRSFDRGGGNMNVAGGSSKRMRSRSRERSKRPRSRSRERSKRPRSRSRDRTKRSKSKDKDRKRSKSKDKDRKKDSKDSKDKEKKDKKSHKKDKPEKEAE